jgi:hypothetical protein
MHSDDFDDDVSADLTGQFLKQADFEDSTGLMFTIARVEKTHFDAKNNRPAEDKWVAYFEGDRCLGLNKTNLALLAKWYGKRARAWVGKPITVYRDENVSFGGRLTGGLRVRRPSKQELKLLSRKAVVDHEADDQEESKEDAPF